MGIADTQLYLAVALPVFGVVLNIVIGFLLHDAAMARFTNIEDRFDRLEAILERH